MSKNFSRPLPGPFAGPFLGLLLLLVVAFALRVFQLDRQSLWYDEAFSVYLARFDLATITARTAADIQPPLYYYLLHVWMLFAGDSEFAVRFFSLAFGVLTVPLMYATARRFNRAAAFFAALIAVLSPLYLWYSQEARMYTLITFLGLLSSYALMRALHLASQEREVVPEDDENAARGNGGGRWWLVVALANIAAVYTHYFAFAIIAFQLLYAIWALVAHRRNRVAGTSRLTAFSDADREQPARVSPRASVRAAFLAFAAIVIAFLPWVPFMLNRLGEDASYWRGALKLDEAVRHIFITFAAGESVLENIAQYVAALWLAVLVVGVIAFVIDERRRTNDERRRTEDERQRTQNQSTFVIRHSSLVFSALYLLVPLVLLLFLFSRNPKFNARYLMLASPGLYLLIGIGLASLWSLAARSGRGVVSGALLVVSLLALGGTALYAISNAYFDPAFTKADLRGVANYITANAHDDEAIILTSGHMFPAFDYYYREAKLTELRLPDEPTLNAENTVGYSAASELNRALSGKRGAWLVLWQDEVADPNGFVPMLLSSRGAEQKQDAAFWQVRLRHWSFPEQFTAFSAQPEIEHPQEANFKNQFKLLGWSQPAPTPADTGASLRLYWQALATTPDDYNVAIRIVDAQGNFWGKVDRRPAGYNYPTARWKEGEALFGDYVATLLPGTPPGDYFANVTLFTRADETGLDVLAPSGAPVGKSVKVGPIKILPATRAPSVLDLGIKHSLSAPAPPFTLLGYDLGREKASTGENVAMTLYWRADQKPDADYSFQVLFGNASTPAYPLTNALNPTREWNAGDIVRGQFQLRVPSDAAAGDTNLQLKLTGGGSASSRNTPTEPNSGLGHVDALGREQVIDLRQAFAVERVERTFEEPTVQFKQPANFGGAIELIGYDLSATEIKPGSVLTVTLKWQAQRAGDKPYTVFVHLLDSASQVKAQRDAQPLNGARPTQTWVEGEYLSDAYPLEIKPDVPPGDYRIEIGWYDSADPAFKRLDVLDDQGSPAGNNAILNQTVSVK